MYSYVTYSLNIEIMRAIRHAYNYRRTRMYRRYEAGTRIGSRLKKRFYYGLSRIGSRLKKRYFITGRAVLVPV